MVRKELRMRDGSDMNLTSPIALLYTSSKLSSDTQTPVDGDSEACIHPRVFRRMTRLSRCRCG